MDKVVQIKPFEQVKTTVVTGMAVRVIRVDLFKSATIHVTLMDSRKSIVDSKVVEINGDDYNQWGGDDTFIYQYVANKLGLSMPDEEVVTQLDVPVEIPQEVSVEVPTDVPVEILQEVSVEAPTDVPVETLQEVLGEAPTDMPVEILQEVPVENLQEVLGETPTDVPVEEILQEVPVEILQDVPVETQDVPVEILQEVLGEIPIEEDAQAPE